MLETKFFFFVFQLLLFSVDLYVAQILEECNEKAFKHLSSYKLFIFQTDSISNQMSIYIWSLKKAQHSFWSLFRVVLKKEKNKSTESKERGFGLQIYLICLVKSDLKFSQIFPFFCKPTQNWVSIKCEGTTEEAADKILLHSSKYQQSLIQFWHKASYFLKVFFYTTVTSSVTVSQCANNLGILLNRNLHM